MTPRASFIEASVRKTWTLRSIVSWRARRRSATRSPLSRVRIVSTMPSTSPAGLAGRSTNGAFAAYSAAAMPARRPKTLMSNRLLVPRRLDPCTETQATSPAAKRPGTTSVLLRSTSVSTLVGTPPMA